jgi:general stress protein YciG
MPNDEKRDMTVREAGRKGGEAVKRKYGSEYYSKIGRKGGNSSGKGSEGVKPAEATETTTKGGT